MPDILVVPLFQVSPQAQLLHGKIYYIADRHGESHSRQSIENIPQSRKGSAEKGDP